jgi:hypothetical protein
VQIFNPRPEGNTFTFTARFVGDSVFEPKLERADSTNGPFLAVPDGLIECLGGGLYRFSVPTSSGVTNEFFRVSFNRP